MPDYLTDVAKRLNLKGQTLFLSQPVVMGILNVTPDSFSDGGSFLSFDKAIDQAAKMITDGATIIDTGGESTRPGSDPVSESEELDRVIPVLEALIPRFPDTFFSIDTTKYSVAKTALDRGVHIINDVSGLQKEPRFTQLALEYQAGLIIMHSKGDPKTMQEKPQYNDLISEIETFFKTQIGLAKSVGLTTNIIIDPGFGFGKTDQHNIEIARCLDRFVRLGYPLLAGVSRKRTIGNITGRTEPKERIAGTIAFHYDNLCKGAKILRVHDVKEAIDSVQIYNALHH